MNPLTLFPRHPLKMTVSVKNCALRSTDLRSSEPLRSTDLRSEPLRSTDRWTASVYMHACMCVHIYIYIYIYYGINICCELLTGPSLGVFKVINWSKFAFFKTLLVKKQYKYMGFSTFLKIKKNCARKFPKLLIGPSWPFVLDPQLGPVNNFDLDQLITLRNGIFVFSLLKMC